MTHTLQYGSSILLHEPLLVNADACRNPIARSCDVVLSPHLRHGALIIYTSDIKAVPLITPNASEKLHFELLQSCNVKSINCTKQLVYYTDQEAKREKV